MKITLWIMAFSLLITATITGIGASIGALPERFFLVSLLCIVGMFGFACLADELGE